MALTKIKADGLTADLIDETKIADNGIDSEHYNDGSIDHAHLANDCVDGDNIADDSINSEHYVNGSIDEAHIADDAVSLAKMAGLARGKIIYGDSSGNPAALALGSNGQVLKSDGTDIAWAADAGGAALSNDANNRVTTADGSGGINGEANLTFDGNDLTLGDGNLILADGHGISFAATAGSAATGASDTSELLDDYEEGTWTPYFQSSTDISSATYNAQNGRYVKIGRLVFCTCEMNGASGGGLSNGSNDLWVKGRPFTMHSGAPNARGSCYLGGITNDTSYYMYFFTTEYYGDNGYVYGKNSGSNHGVAMGAALTDTSGFSAWFVYNAA